MAYKLWPWEELLQHILIHDNQIFNSSSKTSHSFRLPQGDELATHTWYSVHGYMRIIYTSIVMTKRSFSTRTSIEGHIDEECSYNYHWETNQFSSGQKHLTVIKKITQSTSMHTAALRLTCRRRGMGLLSSEGEGLISSPSEGSALTAVGSGSLWGSSWWPVALGVTRDGGRG